LAGVGLGYDAGYYKGVRRGFDNIIGFLIIRGLLLIIYLDF
jgi:hypothetical protein